MIGDCFRSKELDEPNVFACALFYFYF